MIIAVIDLGKSNSKVALVDTTHARELKVITQAATVNLQSIYPSLDHLAIEAFVFESLRSLASHHRIDAITVTTHGATAALIDESGQLAMPVLDYEFNGVDTQRKNYIRHRPSFAETGSPALPGGLNIGAQLHWQQRTYPAQFSTVKTILTWPQYWVYLLTGKLHNDVTSLGCHSDLYAPRMQQYSALVDNMQWQSLMPPTQNSGQLSGTLVPSVSEQTNLPLSTPVYTGIHDSNASLVPHLVNHPAPFSVVSTGTWFIAMAVGGTSISLDETKDTLLNVNAYGDPVPSARFMGGRERELLGVSSTACEHTMEKLLSNHSTPAMLMPSVVPDTGPYPDASLQWINLTPDNNTNKSANKDIENTNALRDCAVTLYLALMTHECMQLIGCDGPTYVEGPLAHDHLYAQMLTAVCNRPVLISESQTGTSVGAAMLISPPVDSPVYSMVTVDQERLEKMIRYASVWQQHKCDHVK